MNTWLIGYIVCCVIALGMGIKAIRMEGILKVKDVFLVLLSVIASPLTLLIYAYLSFDGDFVIWERKK